VQLTPSNDIQDIESILDVADSVELGEELEEEVDEDVEGIHNNSIARALFALFKLKSEGDVLFNSEYGAGRSHTDCDVNPSFVLFDKGFSKRTINNKAPKNPDTEFLEANIIINIKNITFPILDWLNSDNAYGSK